MTQAWETVKAAIAGGPVVVEIKRLTRSLKQNAKLHAMWQDMASTATRDGKSLSLEAWKALCVVELESEYRQEGKELRHPSEVIISLDGLQAITLRATTTRMLVGECNDLIEVTYRVGAEHGARFRAREYA